MPIVFGNIPLSCLSSLTSPSRLLSLYPSRELIHLALALALDAEQGTPARHARLHVARCLHAKLVFDALPALFEIVSHAPHYTSQQNTCIQTPGAETLEKRKAGHSDSRVAGLVVAGKRPYIDYFSAAKEMV